MLIALGLGIDIEKFGIQSHDARGVADACRQQQFIMDKEIPKLEAHETPACRRFVADLCLLHSPMLEGKIQDIEKRRDESARLWAQIGLIESLFPQLVELRDRYHELTVLFPLLEHNPEHPALINQAMEQAARLRQQLAELQDTLGEEKYPFDHAKSGITLREFAVPLVPGEEEVGAILNASGEALGKLGPLYARLLGRLCLSAEAVEKAIGLQPLPEPGKK